MSRPFTHCGVTHDYAGPLILRETKRRYFRNHKAYVAIFVYFATKGVHIELVSDLTSEAFIAALKRLVSRRGKPLCLYSNNSTNFVGAHRQIKEFYDLLHNEQLQGEVEGFLREQGTSWKFIPPNAPHFGGLWEAAVKSAKYHLNRIAGKAHLTFEEMQTVLCEIEAILNSRPLTPLSTDPNDLVFLSPGHFLVGTTLNSSPGEDLFDVNENRWSHECLNSLQEKSKWRCNKGEQLKPNQLVLLKQQGLAPLQWQLGPIEEVQATFRQRSTNRHYQGYKGLDYHALIQNCHTTDKYIALIVIRGS
ncbi:uncharacterized protein LOC112590757 [Harpegnathos saltator]|uniref:uncharacterized protein LOC112590757 n=1 Tax=Harpegnathos saltator TaxID=610380 RepID=UPI00058B7236|nr:uncharacterized protein LOC112590757 [Harpegnathos saltator]